MSTINDTQLELNRLFSNAGISYLSSALSKGYISYYDKSLSGQTIIGNAAIAVELLIKSWLASINLCLPFKDLPTGLLLILFTENESRFAPFRVEILDGRYKTLELDECIALLESTFPDETRLIRSHFKKLSNMRNLAVHAFVPDYQQYQVDRSVYVALRTYMILSDANVFNYAKYRLTKDDLEFISVFDENWIVRVEKALNEAKKAAKSIPIPVTATIAGDDVWAVDCPICGSSAVAHGQCSSLPDSDVIECFAESFDCSQCHLKLEDGQEMELAGIELYFQK